MTEDMTGFLFENFEKIAEAPGGVQRLRELILQLAVTGRLVENSTCDPNIGNAVTNCWREKGLKNPAITAAVEWPFRTPSNWVIFPLGQIGTTITGTTPSTVKPENYGNFINFIKPGNISIDKITYLGDMLSEVGLLEGRLIPRNSILMVCIGGSIGKCTVVDRDVSCNQQINAISPLNCIYPQYLFNVLKSSFIQQSIKNSASQGTLPIISKSKWERIPIPVPPLSEQQRIVEKVDFLMALCDELEAKQTQKHTHLVRLGTGSLTALQQSDTPGGLVQWWEHLQNHFGLIFDCVENVEALRQTILQLAVTGRLGTGDERDEPVIQLIRQIIDEKGQLVKSGIIGRTKDVPVIADTEIPYNIPNNWQWIRLDHISYISTGSTPSTTNPDYYYNGVIPWVTSSKTSMSKIYAADKKITQKAVDDCSLKIYPIGTLLVALYGQGKTRGQVSELKIESTINQACAAICFFEISKSISSYIKIVLKGNYNSIRSISAGGAQPNLNLDKIKRMLIPLPPLAEQHRILEKVNTLMALCDQVEQNIDHRSKKSISLSNATIQRITGLT